MSPVGPVDPDGELLRLDAVSVRRGRRLVVHDVDLVVGAGEVVALLGPNGAGKSTLLEAIGGLVPAASGRRAVGGRVATVLQQPGLARRSVRANIELALSWWGVPRGQRRARAEAALELMRAAHLAHRPAAALSGGERRRVHVARGLAVRPDLLLLDEPFAGLDVETREALTADTAAAVREAAQGVVVVLHERADAWAMADRFVILEAGRVVADGAPRDLLATPPTAEVARFLGYDGELRVDDGLVLTRTRDVVVDPAGEWRLEVVRVVAHPDGALLDLRCAAGRLRAATADPSGIAVGDEVAVRLDRPLTFPR